MEDLICDDCGLATAWYTRELVHCPVLGRSTRASETCRVSIDGLMERVRENESLSDHVKELKEEYDDLDYDDDWHYRWVLGERIDRLEGGARFWPSALKHLWGRTLAPNRECSRCGHTPIRGQGVPRSSATSPTPGGDNPEVGHIRSVSDLNMAR